MLKKENSYLASLGLLGEQLEQASIESLAVFKKYDFKNVENIVVGGMGGSQLGADLVLAGLEKELKVPVTQIRDYVLPKFVGKKTLLILISYSGSTEEVLSLAENACKTGCKIAVISAGGKLGEFAKKNNLPAYIFSPRFNPAGQPRLGTGYVLAPFLVLLQLSKAIVVKENLASNIAQAGKMMEKDKTLIAKTKQVAKLLKGKAVLVVAGEFLKGSAHILANQLNESAKQLAWPSYLPEINHHLMEGLTCPATNQKNLAVLFLNSSLYTPRIAKRLNLTELVVKKQKIKTINFSLKGTLGQQAIGWAIFGGRLAWELSLLNKTNPLDIRWVDFFKKKLG